MHRAGRCHGGLDGGRGTLRDAILQLPSCVWSCLRAGGQGWLHGSWEPYSETPSSGGLCFPYKRQAF